MEIEAGRLYKVEQVQEILGGVDRRTVWRMRARGNLIGRRIGKRWYFLGADLLQAD